MRRLTFSLTLMAACLAGCSNRFDRQQHFATLNKESEALKRAFNADRGKVRVLMLVSPT